MEVIHPRCVGLDVHKDTVVACVRLAIDGPMRREVQDLRHDVREFVGVDERAGLHPCGDGGHRDLLEAGLEYSERRRFRIGVGQCRSYQECARP